MFTPGAPPNPLVTGQVVFDIAESGAADTQQSLVTLRDGDTGVVLGRRAVEGDSSRDLSRLLQQSLFEQVGGVYRLESVRLDVRTAALDKRTAAIESRVRRKRRRRAIALPKKRFLDCEAPTMIGTGREKSARSHAQAARPISETPTESLAGAQTGDLSYKTPIARRPHLRLIHCDGPEQGNRRNSNEPTILRMKASADTPSAAHLWLVPEEDCAGSVSDAMANALQATIASIMAEDS